MTDTMPDTSSAERQNEADDGAIYRARTLGTACETTGQCAPDAVTEKEPIPGPVTAEEIARVMTDFQVFGIPPIYEDMLHELIEVARPDMQPVLFVWDAGNEGRAVLTRDGLRIENARNPTHLWQLASGMMPQLLDRAEQEDARKRDEDRQDDEEGCPISQAGETLWRALTGTDADDLRAASDVMLDLVNTVWESTPDSDPAAANAPDAPEPMADPALNWPRDTFAPSKMALEAEIDHALRPEGTLDRAFTRVAATGSALVRLTVGAEGGDQVYMELVDDMNRLDQPPAADDGHLWPHAADSARREGASIIERGQGGALIVRSPQTHQIERVEGWPGLPAYRVKELAD